MKKVKLTNDLLMSVSEYLSVCVNACLGTTLDGPRQHNENDAWLIRNKPTRSIRLLIASPLCDASYYDLSLPLLDKCVLDRMIAPFGFPPLKKTANAACEYESFVPEDKFIDRVTEFYRRSGVTYVVFGERLVRGKPTPRSRSSVNPGICANHN